MRCALSYFLSVGVILATFIAPAAAQGSYVLVDPPAVEKTQLVAAKRGRHLVYLNRAGGQFFGSSRDDASTNESSILKGRNVVPAIKASDEQWDEVRDCIEDLFDDFVIDFAKIDPEDTKHVEVVFGGSPADVGVIDSVQGVAPLATNCSVLDRAVVFVFTEELMLGSSLDVQRTCEVAAQEIAHAFGLDHEYHAEDLMSYLLLPGVDAKKVFVNEDKPCGEWTPRDCQCMNKDGTKDTQNSYARLAQVLGVEGERLGGTGDLEGSCGLLSATKQPGGVALLLVVMFVAVGRRTRRAA